MNWLAFIIIGIGTFFRLYHLPQSVVFLGDQGRDALIARRILIEHHPALIGPVTSVGNMYLGPFYYYFMVPFLALTYPIPSGPVYGVAVANCLSLVGVYLLTKKWFNQPIAYISTFLYSLAPLGINYSRFSWNPNLSAPMSVVLLYGLFEWLKTRSNKSFFIIIISLAILIQLHYVAGITVVIVGCIWLWSFFQNSAATRKILIKQLMVLATVLVIAILPLVIFDFRHDFMIGRRFGEFIFSPEGHLRNLGQLGLTIKEMEGRAIQHLIQLLTGEKHAWNKWFFYIVIAASSYLFSRSPKQIKILTPTKTIIIWLIMSIGFTSIYTSNIFDHYILFNLPALTIFWGLLLYKLSQHYVFGKITAVILIGILSFLTYPQLSTIKFSGNGFDTYINTVQSALPYLETPYNIALLNNDRDYQGMNYRYFFTITPKPPESAGSYTNLKQLVIIDEVGTQDPFSIPAHEVQAPSFRKLTHKTTVPGGPTLLFYGPENTVQ